MKDALDWIPKFSILKRMSSFIHNSVRTFTDGYRTQTNRVLYTEMYIDSKGLA